MPARQHSTQRPVVLVVEDDPLQAQVYAVILEEYDIPSVEICTDGLKARAAIDLSPVDLVLLDLNMPGLPGQQVLRDINTTHPEIPVLVLTSEDNVETAVECMKLGAFDYMTKPVDETRLVTSVRHALTIRDLKLEVDILSRRDLGNLQNPAAFHEIITNAPAMRQIFGYIEAIAPSPKAVLVTGESGTGKELIARVIHRLSGRKGNFVPVNVSGVDDTVFSDTLFGHRRGSFTGADTMRRGLIDQAGGGTLFLDEIGDMEHGSQVKLLRLLQEGEYYPLGSDVAERSTARIVAATNANVHERQKTGSFRKDLYYRLIAHHIELPPLRHRREDIRLLTDHFLAEAAKSLSRPTPTVPKEIYTLLAGYDFPGNIRELQSLIFDAVSRHESGVLSLRYLREFIDKHRESTGVTNGDGRFPPFDHFSDDRALPKLSEVEDFMCAEALRRADGNQSIAARMLGISQSTLSRWVKKTKWLPSKSPTKD